MVAQLMETLQLICDEREAQLIVASHSSLVWDWFAEEERIDLSGWREARAMSGAPDWMTPQALPTLKQGKNVLAVEGDDDKDVYKAWLQEAARSEAPYFPDTVCDRRCRIAKTRFSKGLGWYTGVYIWQTWGNLYGLVDRDEWDSSSICGKNSRRDTHDCSLTRVAIASRATSSSQPSLKQP